MTRPTLLVLGAGSDIARAIAHRFASHHYAIILAARNSGRFTQDADDIALRYDVPATVAEYDTLNETGHEAFVDVLGVLPEVTVCCIGLMPSQKDAQSDIVIMQKVFRSNFEGPASVLSVLADRLEKRGSGTIVGISSVAGERGRASNYVYGSAKAGFTAFLSGLRNRFAGTGVHVITVLPGFVRTAMTEGMDLTGALTATPEEVARAVYMAVTKRKDRIYVKSVWRLVMTIICNLPESIFKRMKI